MERLCITVGDPSGIGPEVILKSLSSPKLSEHALIVISPLGTIESAAERLGIEPGFKGKVDSPVEVDSPGSYIHAGSEIQPSESSNREVRDAKVALAAIKLATEFCAKAEASAMITAPVNKSVISKAEESFRGQTEFIGRLTGASEPTMMMAAGELRVALLTTHEAMADVAGHLTSQLIASKLRVIHSDLKTLWRIDSPRLALLGLNPHAGEAGLIGAEEERIFSPAVAEASRDGINVHGPFSPDAYFSRGAYENYDAVVAAYHDQGLIPFKLLSSGAGVNVTLGLPIVRTSPEHGTGFDIAGRGLADPTSMINAISLAAKLAKNRRMSE